MHFEVIGKIAEIETIAAGPSVRIRSLLRKRYGGTRWRKLKGVAQRAAFRWYDTFGGGALVRSPRDWEEEDANQALSGLLTWRLDRQSLLFASIRTIRIC